MAQPPPTPPEDLEPTFRGFLGSHGESAEAPAGGHDLLAFARWEHPSPRGRVVISHGYGEHGERYRHVARWLHRAGWSVSALDHRGYGRSGGVRGDARGIRPAVEDLAFFLRQERRHDADLAAAAGSGPAPAAGIPVAPAPAGPQILLGHSYGGLLALLTLLWHPDTLEGLILSSPALQLRPLTWPLRVLHRVLLGLAPHRPLDLPNDKALVCSDPGFVQRYWEDPLCHRMVTASFLSALTEGRRELLAMGGELDRPILLLEAGLDTVVDPDASEQLWSAVRPGLLERYRMDGFRHEIFHDLGRQSAEDLASRWLDHLFPAGTPAPMPHELKETT
jgi:alpha-beta hydrolase superfamily lysophospholipase